MENPGAKISLNRAGEVEAAISSLSILRNVIKRCIQGGKNSRVILSIAENLMSKTCFSSLLVIASSQMKASSSINESKLEGGLALHPELNLQLKNKELLLSSVLRLFATFLKQSPLSEAEYLLNTNAIQSLKRGIESSIQEVWTSVFQSQHGHESKSPCLLGYIQKKLLVHYNLNAHLLFLWNNAISLL